ncbi:MAG: putative transposase [Candidatus Anammoxibacter sp.]
MIEHFNIDALIDYKVDKVNETKKVVNPEYRKIEGDIKSKAGKLGRGLMRFAEMSLSPVPSSNELEEYEIKKGNLIEEIDFLKKELLELKEKRKSTNKHILLSEMPEEERFSQLGSKRKHFIDTIKMIAYRAETAMVTILRESLARTDDARSLLRDIFTLEADIIPDEKEQTLTIRLHHLTNRLSDKAALHLADYLNNTETIYPGTNMRLIYKLVS